MIEVKDEILAGEPRYRFKDSNGNIVMDNVDISQITSVIQSGTPINKDFFDALQTALISICCPSGLICMWSGIEIPNGWALCDGQNGTPDLRDRFIVGSGNAYNIGNTGGTDRVSLVTSELPSHSHQMYFGWDTVSSGTNGVRIRSTQGGSITFDLAKVKDAAPSTTNTGIGQSHENRPPYYALAFIMKL